ESSITEKYRDQTPLGTLGQHFLRLKATYTGVRDSWETNAPMPVALDEVAGGVIGRNLYVVGGGHAATLAYDIAAGRWTNLVAPRPFPGNHHAVEAFLGKLYLFGGLGGGAEGKVQI